MSKLQIKLSLVSAVLFGIAVVLFSFALRAAQTGYLESLVDSAPATFPVCGTNIFPSTAPLVVKPAVATNSFAPPVENPGVLNERRQRALSMIETGNNDGVIGSAGEVSRYQIMPSVWKHYSRSRRYHDPETSLEVAQQHWSVLYAWFKQQSHREPTDFDMYVLWNTRYGYYASRGFKPAHLDPVVRDRAQRFVNLVERGES